MNIGEAVQHMKDGGRVARAGWNGKNMYLMMVVPHERDYEPYVQMYTAQGKYIPWLCSQADLLANDWDAVPIL